MRGFFNLVRKARAFVRWIGRNPPLRFAKLAARHRPVRALALVTQPLWLTPDLLGEMRPMRKLGYLFACIVAAASMWTDATLSLFPDATALMVKKMAELGAITGWWTAGQSAAVAVAATVSLTAVFILGMALWGRIDLAIARGGSRLVRVTPPRRVTTRYYILMVAGDIAAIFALFWIVMKAVSPPGLAMLRWLNQHPILGSPLLVLIGLAYFAGYVRWQHTLQERSRQIYGEGRRPMIYSTASLAVSISVMVTLGALMHVGRASVGGAG